MALALGGCEPVSKLVGALSASLPPLFRRPSHARPPTVVDIAPGVGKISPEFRAYLDAMQEIDAAKVSSRKKADEILQKTEPVRPLDPPYSSSPLTTVLTPLTLPGPRRSPIPPYQPRPPLSLRPLQVPSSSSIPQQRHRGDRVLPLCCWREDVREADAFLERCGSFISCISPSGCPLTDLVIRTGSKSKYINSRNIPLIKQFFPNSELVTLETGHWGALSRLSFLLLYADSHSLLQCTRRSQRSL